MKKICTLIIASLFTLTIAMQAQTTYNITSSRTWGNLPTNPVNCTFNISQGVTLTIDKDVTAQTCTFNGGIISMTSKSLILQTSNNTFSNTTFNIGGNGKITASAPMTVTNSTFTFSGSSQFIAHQLLDITSSTFRFNGSSSMIATGGPVNLKGTTTLIAGDGTPGSSAYIMLNGPNLNLYNTSSVLITGSSNYYFNWSPYYVPATGQSYVTKVNNSPYVYGPVALTVSGVTTSVSLPVILAGFNVKLLTNQSATLAWQTEQESNSGYFAIERSADGVQWSQIGKVNAKGNSSTVTLYSFNDKNLQDGVNYYRLKMVDLDGSAQYSDTRSVRSTLNKQVSVYPNPTTDYINVSLSASSEVNTVRLLNTAGQIMLEREPGRGTNGKVSLPVQQFHAGNYLVQVIYADGSQQSTLVMINK